MKYIRITVVLLILALLLTACGGQEAYEVVTPHGILTIDPGRQTITQGSDVYRYSVSGSTTTIHYPNGAAYHTTVHPSDSAATYDSGWSYDYDAAAYIPGDVLFNALDQVQSRNGSVGQMVLGLICVVLGALTIAFPKGMWYLAVGWRYTGLEPSEAALVLDRLGGIALIILGLLFFFA